jgi:hypothetical protein
MTRSGLAHEDLGQLPDVEVMCQLHSSVAVQAEAAKAELQRRGYEAVHLQLARRLVDPDPEVRRRLAEALPQVAAVDVRPWLLWLTRDEEPQVRQAAITIIATSADPALRRRLRELAGEETDPDVLRVVRRVLAGRTVE